MITVLTCRSTGERARRTGEYAPRASRAGLDSSKYLIGPDVDYPASVGPANPQNLVAGCSEGQLVAMGVRALVAEIRATPNRV